MNTGERFLRSNSQLVRELKMANLLNSHELMLRKNQKLKQTYEEFSQQPENPFSDEIPLEYVLGSIVVGNSTQNQNILIKADFENLSGHILSIGATGSGKTHWILTILDQVISQYESSNLRVIVFAPKEGCEQRNLVMNNKPGSSIFLDKNSLALNPLSSIKNVDDEIIVADAARVISNELGLLVGGQLYLQDKLNEFLLSHKGETFLSFIEWISKKKETSYDLKGYHDRLVIRLNSLKLESKNIFDCVEGIDEKHFIENNLIIELPFSSSFIMSVISGLILSRMFRYKAANLESLDYKNITVLEDVQGAMRNV